jgi:hypothetical protein
MNRMMICIIAVTVFLVHGGLATTVAGDHRRLDTSDVGQGTLKPGKGPTDRAKAMTKWTAGKAKHVKSQDVPLNKTKLGKQWQTPANVTKNSQNKTVNTISNVWKTKRDTKNSTINNTR